MYSLKTVYYILLVISSIALIANRKKLPTYCNWLVALLPLSLTVQAVEDLVKFSGAQSYFIFHIFQPLEMLLLCGFYYSAFKNPLFKQASIMMFLTFLLVMITYYVIQPAKLTASHFFDFVIEAFLLCILIVLFFIEMLQVKEQIHLKFYTAFWLNAIHLVFFGGCLFMMGFYYYLENSAPILAKQFIHINYYLNLLLYASYTIIFICTKAIKK